MNSLKFNKILSSLKKTVFSLGEDLITTGGILSLLPPSIIPLVAHFEKIKTLLTVIKRKMKFFIYKLNGKNKDIFFLVLYYNESYLLFISLNFS